ncbi:MAG TPA: TolC family protein [Candidatus Limnocylindrales bacterium]|nr:TolC family protein [Candidatus Limnocylindrales bacterium]
MSRRLEKLQGLAVAVAAAMLLSGSAFAQDTQVPQKLTLRGAITLALQNSRDVKLARLQYNVALSEARVDRASFLPNLYTGGGYVYTYGFPSVPGAGPPAVFQLDYTQSLFNPLLKGEQRAAEDRARSQKVEVDHVQDEVIVRTASVYLELAEVRHLSELMQNDQASAEKILEVTRERVAANQELPIEETKAELTAARIRERLIKLQDRDEALSQQLHDLTAVPDNQTIEVDAEEPSFTTDVQESQIADLAVRNDRGIQEAENERAARQKLLRAARLSYWPTVDVVGQYSVFSRMNNYDEYYNRFQRNNFNAGIEITIPLFAAKTSANVAFAKSQLQEAEQMLSNKRQQVRLESRQTSREQKELEAGRDVARLDLKLAQQTLEMTQAKLEDGKATLRDVEQARLDESDKWMQFLDADLAWQKGQLKILEATGQLSKVLQ